LWTLNTIVDKCSTSPCHGRYLGMFGTPEEAGQVYLQHFEKRHVEFRQHLDECEGGTLIMDDIESLEPLHQLHCLSAVSRRAKNADSSGVADIDFRAADPFSLGRCAEAAQVGQHIALSPLHAGFMLKETCSMLDDQLKVGSRNVIKLDLSQDVVISSLSGIFTAGRLPEDVCLDVVKLFGQERYSGTLMQPLQLEFTDTGMDMCGDGLLVTVFFEFSDVFE
jgi:hypothetical protein